VVLVAAAAVMTAVVPLALVVLEQRIKALQVGMDIPHLDKEVLAVVAVVLRQ
jgi:hypothetical protein